MLVTVILSLAIISVSTGAISVDKEFSIGGFKFELTTWVVFFGGTCLVTIFHIYFLSLSLHEEHLRNVIVRLYKSLKFSDQSLDNLRMNPLEFPNILIVLFEKSYLGDSLLAKYFFGSLDTVLSLALLILPVIVEIIVGYRMLRLVGRTWWVFVSFSFLILLSISYLVVYWKNLASDE